MQGLLGYNLAQASIPAFSVFERSIGSPLGLRQVEFTILVLLDSNAEVTKKALSHALDIAAPNLTVILDRLEKKGLLTRTRSEDDKRAQHVHLTSKGRTLVQKADAIALVMEQELLGHFTSAEQAMLFELLQRVAVLRKAGR